MSDPSLALQGALAAKIKGSTGGGDLGVADRVYDKVPDKPTFPYVRIGDDQVVGDDDDCEELSEVFTRIHVWSQAGGKPEAKRIAGLIRSRLRTATFTLAGYTVDNIEFVQTIYLDDADGLSVHAVIELRFLITHA